ncbi:hypothetical protein niasHT_035589 [Heterodera trifolii]|uniref:Uncharacterized protein n=1 Tax=Heterodera trifolii TaxID=157864 RepID=A0ABD2IX30_9BILA
MICQHDSSLCDQGYLEDQYSKCEKIQCCRDDFCNYVPDRVIPKPPIVIISGVIGLHTPLGIGYIVFATRICQLVLIESKNEEKGEWEEKNNNDD